MSTSVSRAFQNVKPHIRMIKFRHQQQEAAVVNSTASSQPVSANPNQSITYPVPLDDGKGISDTQIPLRFRRRPIDTKEMEFITRGGPE